MFYPKMNRSKIMTVPGKVDAGAMLCFPATMLPIAKLGLTYNDLELNDAIVHLLVSLGQIDLQNCGIVSKRQQSANFDNCLK